MMLVDAAKWLLFFAGALILMGAGAANWAVLVGYLFKRGRGSMTPLAGGATAAVALALCPVTWLRNYWWLPLLLDPGYALWVAEHLVWAIWRRPGDRGSR
jgi:hypothetical protein